MNEITKQLLRESLKPYKITFRNRDGKEYVTIRGNFSHSEFQKDIRRRIDAANGQTVSMTSAGFSVVSESSVTMRLNAIKLK